MPDISNDAHSDADIVRYDVHTSSLGHVLIAVSTSGVCAILFGDDGAALQKELRRRFARATLGPPNEFSRRLATSVLALIETQGVETPPLDFRGTDFQKRVWRALLGIPAGATISYKELASRAGTPGAIRAVAGACAANPLAFIVPCHRVVRNNGEISGYRWGVARKQALLKREGALAGDAKTIGARLAPGLG